MSIWKNRSVGVTIVENTILSMKKVCYFIHLNETISKTYSLGSRKLFMLDIRGPNLPRSFFSQPTHLLAGSWLMKSEIEVLYFGRSQLNIRLSDIVNLYSSFLFMRRDRKFTAFPCKAGLQIMRKILIKDVIDRYREDLWLPLH